jgi:NtrC-family two-component system response regulator AlgB
VIAATNEDLRQRVRERAFRQDLLYRLDVASVEMPPLRAMREVIPELAERFVREIAAELRRPVPRVSSESFAELPNYPWPGNVRELRNAVERALIFAGSGPLRVLPPKYDPDTGPAGPRITLEYGLTLEEVERRYLGAMLSQSPRELGEIASDLGISRKTLWEKRRRYAL